MFKNIVEKLKLVANIEFFAGIILSVILGIVLFSSRLFFEGIIYFLIGTFGSYVVSLLLFGFATIIENTNNLKSVDTYEGLSDEELKNKFLNGELDGNIYLKLLEEKKKQ